MTPVAFALWAGMAIHNNNVDDGMRDKPYAAVIEASATYKNLRASLNHKSLPEKKDNGETWLEFKYRLW